MLGFTHTEREEAASAPDPVAMNLPNGKSWLFYFGPKAEGRLADYETRKQFERELPVLDGTEDE